MCSEDLKTTLDFIPCLNAHAWLTLMNTIAKDKAKAFLFLLQAHLKHDGMIIFVMHWTWHLWTLSLWVEASQSDSLHGSSEIQRQRKRKKEQIVYYSVHASLIISSQGNKACPPVCGVYHPWAQFRNSACLNHYVHCAKAEEWTYSHIFKHILKWCWSDLKQFFFISQTKHHSNTTNRFMFSWASSLALGLATDHGR